MAISDSLFVTARPFFLLEERAAGWYVLLRMAVKYTDTDEPLFIKADREPGPYATEAEAHAVGERLVYKLLESEG